MESLGGKSFLITDSDFKEGSLSPKKQDKAGLRLLLYADQLEQDQRALTVCEIKEEAKLKARLIVEEVLECSHPALLADFLNDRAFKANDNSRVFVKYKNLTLDIEEDMDVDPRALIVLNYAKILQILREVEMKSPTGARFKREREVLSIEIPE